MSKNYETTGTGGVGLCGLLFIAFLVLKLTNVINWSWWCITAPLWAPFALVILIFLVTMGILIRKENRRNNYD